MKRIVAVHKLNLSQVVDIAAKRKKRDGMLDCMNKNIVSKIPGAPAGGQKKVRVMQAVL